MFRVLNNKEFLSKSIFARRPRSIYITSLSIGIASRVVVICIHRINLSGAKLHGALNILRAVRGVIATHKRRLTNDLISSTGKRERETELCKARLAAFEH